MSKHILLVNPWIYDFAAFDLWLKPLGLLYLSSILKKYDFKISLIDTMDRKHPSMQKHPSKDKNYGTGKFYNETIDKPAILNFIPRKYRRFGMPPDIFLHNLQQIKNPDIIFITSFHNFKS